MFVLASVLASGGSLCVCLYNFVVCVCVLQNRHNWFVLENPSAVTLKDTDLNQHVVNVLQKRNCVCLLRVKAGKEAQNVNLFKK